MEEDGGKIGYDDVYDTACEADAGRETSSRESGRDYSGISADYGGAGEDRPD